MDSVGSRTLLECKLRRCVYLGTCYSIYIPPAFRDKFWGRDYEHHRFDYHIIKTIGNAVNKCDIKKINSIVPILRKIHSENPLHGENNLMFALAVCAKLNLSQCQEMVRDAYLTVDIFCTDGRKLLMFAQYCNQAAIMLHAYGYLPHKGNGLSGSGFKKAMHKWYSKRNTLETLQMILQYKRFQSMTHRRILNNVKYFSNDPVHRIIVIYVTQSMNDVKEYYRMMKRGSKRNDDYKKLSFSLLNIVYRYLQDFVIKFKIESDHDIRRFTQYVRMNFVGQHHDGLPLKWQYDLNFLPSYVEHMPLRSLLSKTCCMAKNGLFYNLRAEEDCLTFINRFNHKSALQKSQIHPIESYVTFLKYAKTGEVISDIKKQKDPLEWKIIDHYFFKSTTDHSKSLEENNNVELDQPNDKNNNNIIKSKQSLTDSKFFMKPLPKYSALLEKLLKNDLVAKTLDNIPSPGCRIFIAYDSRPYLIKRKCRYPHLKVVKIIDAITLTILSLIYSAYRQPITIPTIVALNDTKWRFEKINIDLDDEERFTVESLKKILFKEALKCTKPYFTDSEVKPVYPLSTINWARKRKLQYDVFIFLATHKTDFIHLNRTKAEYSSFLGRRVRIIFCCLDGKYKEQMNLSREGMLYIPGYDKYIGQIMQSFINDKF